jgi:hypothetical protein
VQVTKVSGTYLIGSKLNDIPPERTYLYNLGDECPFLTGGWSNSGYSITGLTQSAPIENADNIDLSARMTSTSKILCITGTAATIDFTDYTKMGITLDVITCPSGSGTYGRIGVVSTKTNPNTNQIAVFNLQGQSLSGIVTRYIDLSAVSGNYYVYGFVSSEASNLSVRYKIKEVWLEK